VIGHAIRQLFDDTPDSDFVSYDLIRRYSVGAFQVPALVPATAPGRPSRFCWMVA
jgi:hypothetical protein